MAPAFVRTSLTKISEPESQLWFINDLVASSKLPHAVPKWSVLQKFNHLLAFLAFFYFRRSKMIHSHNRFCHPFLCFQVTRTLQYMEGSAKVRGKRPVLSRELLSSSTSKLLAGSTKVWSIIELSVSTKNAVCCWKTEHHKNNNLGRPRIKPRLLGAMQERFSLYSVAPSPPRPNQSKRTYSW